MVIYFQVKNKFVFIGVLSLIAVLYTYTTHDRNKDWKNNKSLYLAGAKATPNNSRAISALGSVKRQEAEQTANPHLKLTYYREALTHYEKSIELFSANSDSYYNIGVIYMNLNQNKKARKSFLKAVQYAPDMIMAHNNIGVIYFNEKNYPEAKKYFENCLRLNPDFSNGVANLGAIYHNLGQLELARQYYMKALELNPNDLSVKNNLKKL